MTKHDTQQLERMIAGMTDAEKRELIERLARSLDSQSETLQVASAGHDNGDRPRTPLGKRLGELRRRVVDSGHPLLDWDALEHEIKTRRGERNV